MASGKPKTIEEIDDLSEMFDLMAALGISCKELKTLEQMRTRVKTELNQSAAKPCWTAGQAFAILSEARDEDAWNRQALLTVYSDTEDFLKKMDEKLIDLPPKSVVNIQEKIKHHQAQLKRKEYFLLLAGETGSGKSSLINLILGEELLPYSVLCTTSTICELRYGDQPRIVAHFKDKGPETGPPIEVPLKSASSEQSCLEQISPYIHVKSDREKGSIYKNVEVFWPHQLLKKGVVIIDSPGIGESDIMDDVVKHYLPEAFAFIYVINSENAGGVQKDRLEKLLDEVRRVTLEREEESVSSQCALFVCNKWDRVPKKETKDVQDHVITKLKKRWPGLDPKSQIIYMSTKYASVAQNYGIVNKDFSSLMSAMRSMILKSIEARLEMHWRWLDNFLSWIIFEGKAFVKNAFSDRDQVAAKMGSIMSRLVQIEEKQTEEMKDLHNYLKNRIKGAMQKLGKYLKSHDVRARFTTWTLDNVPVAESSWEVTKSNITKAFENRLREYIEDWEEDHEVFLDARKSLLHHFQQRYNFVEGQLQNLQVAVTSDDSKVPENIPADEGLTTTEKVVIGVTSPLWVPLTLFVLVICAPVVGRVAIKNKLEDKRRIKEYERDKCAFMKENSAIYLDYATKEKELEVFVKDQLKEANLFLKQIEARIPELIEAGKKFYRRLGDERRSKKEVKELYQPIIDEASDIRCNLAAFQEFRSADISSAELDWKEDKSCRIGSGAFATVYQGKIRRQGEEQTVAVKVAREVLDAANASLIKAKVDLLRKLDHPHIVKFYGTSLLKKEDTTRVILVMEKCKGSLKSQIFDNPEAAPAKTRDPEVFRVVCRWAQEITDALAFMHKQGVLHRDLKLGNILLSEDNSVRITDVGVFKDVKDITGTLAGTPVYIAPEVFHSKLYDSKADIYSFSIMLWEMWYGRQAFAEFKGLKTPLFNFVDGDHRPKDMEGSKEPPARWKQLMSRCWDGNPRQRPSAKICFQEITAILSDDVV